MPPDSVFAYFYQAHDAEIFHQKNDKVCLNKKKK